MSQPHDPDSPTPSENTTASQDDESRRSDLRRESRVEAWKVAGFYQRHRIALSGTGLDLKSGEAFFDRIQDKRLEIATTGVLRDGGTLILCGDRGTGKTLLSSWISLVDAWFEHGDQEPYTSAYRVWPDLLQEQRASWQEKIPDPLEAIKGSTFLVLDEIGEVSTEWSRSQMTRIIDYRYGNMLRTILIGNVQPGDIEAHIGSSAYSRICETGSVLHANWEPYR